MIHVNLVFISLPSHWFGEFLLVGAGVFVSRDVSGRVHYVHASALPFPRPLLSKRSLCDPVNLVVSVRRLTVGDATALCGCGHFIKDIQTFI